MRKIYMTLTIKLFQPTQQAFPPQWDEFVTKYQLLPIWRAAPIYNMAQANQDPFWLAVVCEGTEPQALFVGRVRSALMARGNYYTNGDSLPFGFFDCQLPLSFSPGVAFSPRLIPEEISEIIYLFEKSLAQQLTVRQPFILYRQLGAQAELPVFSHLSGLRKHTSPIAILQNEWHSLTDYFNTLPRKYRRHFQNLYHTTNSTRISIC